MVNLIERRFSANAPNTIANVPPFTTPGRFTTPNESYFAHADAVISYAGQKGITVLLNPLYLGWECGSQGWCPEVQASSLSDMRSWGRYVGNRYRSFPNIIWLIGADVNPITYGVDAKLLEMVAGIREFDTVHLMTAHNNPGTSAQDTWNGAAWLDLNTVYHYGITELLGMTHEEYTRPNALPLFMLESAYENSNSSTAASLRQQAYSATLWGGTLGSIFGNCPLWSLGFNAGYCAVADWRAQLGAVGSVEFGHFVSLMRSRRFWLMAPDHSRSVMTAGFGSGATVAVAARASDGSGIVAYIPTQRQVTIAMSGITDAGGQARSSWYNPRTGQTTLIGTYSNTGTRNFTPPDSNDWVLVIDAATTANPPLSPPVSVSASYSSSPGAGWNACDLSQDSLVNVVDVQLAVNMTLGTMPCTAAVNGLGVCTIVTVQRVINAGLGQACVVDPIVGPLTVTLSWAASPSSGVAGYNVYRAASSGGPYAKVSPVPVAGSTFRDITVQAGRTYYYVITAADAAGNEGGYSSQVAAVVP